MIVSSLSLQRHQLGAMSEREDTGMYIEYNVV
jgi:hypothetical protein